MSRILKCSVKESMSFWKVLFYIIGSFLMINFIILVSDLITTLIPQIRIPFSIALIFIIIGAISFFINRKLSEYIYVLLADEFIVYKKIGKRERTMIKVNLEDIEEIYPLEDEKNRKKDEREIKKNYAYACKLVGEGLYVGKFIDNENLYRFIFQPDGKFLKSLKSSVKDRKRMMKKEMKS